LRRLKLAGADQVISAYQYGGYRVASTIVRPSVVDFIELFTSGRGEEIDLEEIRIPEASQMVGKSVVEIEQSLTKLRIVALKRNDEPIRIIPRADFRIEAGDLLVVIGDRAGLDTLVRPE
jgi:voltage-gated potassium channel